MSAVDVVMFVTLAAIVCLGWLCQRAHYEAKQARAQNKPQLADIHDEAARFFGFVMFIVMGVFVLLGTIFNPSFFGPQ